MGAAGLEINRCHRPRPASDWTRIEARPLNTPHYSGLIAATFTPMHPDGRLNLSRVGPMVDRLVADGVRGLYVCGSTGEGPCLSVAERKEVVEAFLRASNGRVPVIAQVGHDSLIEAADLACHAAGAGADAISAVPPYYFNAASARIVADCIERVAEAAPELPFYYYHIPAMTRANIDVVELVELVQTRLPTFAGVKFSASALDVLQTLSGLDRRPNLLFGVDEFLLSGLVAGADGAVGSTYNFATPLFRRVVDAFDRGQVAEAAEFQAKACRLVRTILRYGAQPAMKSVMALIGLDCGPSRLPLRSLEPGEHAALREDLARLDLLPIEGSVG